MYRVTRFFSSSLPGEHVRRLYCDEGLSTRGVAKALGCSETAVRNRLASLGIARRTPWGARAVAASTDELRRLYCDEGLSLSAVAARAGCSLSTVWRRLNAAGVAVRPDGSAPVFERRDFGGDPLEKAYLVGFRLGDLHVALEGTTVVVKCTSTRKEQVQLFRDLFEPYGRVYTDEATIERRQRKAVGMYARLNRSFEFLLPKECAVPEWALGDDETFLSFLAGYIDAEGSIQLYSRSKRLARLDIKSYDMPLLMQCWHRLAAMGIRCPRPRLDVAAGYTNKYGVISRQDTWRLGAYSASTLVTLLSKLLPYMKHNKRVKDANAALMAATMLLQRQDPKSPDTELHARPAHAKFLLSR